MNKFIILLALATLLNSCGLFPKNCKDEVFRNITQAELDFFPDYIIDDTIRYKDRVSGEKYYAVCTQNETHLRKRFFSEDHHCAGGGYYIVLDKLEFVFNANFPSLSKIKVNYYSRGNHNLILILESDIPFTYDYVSN
jgi:hypothetical protein